MRVVKSWNLLFTHEVMTINRLFRGTSRECSSVFRDSVLRFSNNFFSLSLLMYPTLTLLLLSSLLLASTSPNTYICMVSPFTRFMCVDWPLGRTIFSFMRRLSKCFEDKDPVSLHYFPNLLALTQHANALLCIWMTMGLRLQVHDGDEDTKCSKQ